MKKYIILLCCISACNTTKNLQVEKTYNNINKDNYYDLLKENTPGISTNWIRKEETLDTIFSKLRKMKLVVVRGAIFELEDGTPIPIDGYLPYEKVGFIVQPGFSAAISNRSRSSKFIEYYKYDTKGDAYLQSAEVNSPNLFIFKTDWYWYQSISIDSYKDKFKNDTLISKNQSLQILYQDIHHYFDKYKKE